MHLRGVLAAGTVSSSPTSMVGTVNEMPMAVSVGRPERVERRLEDALIS
jgi:hypothetical protein